MVQSEFQQNTKTLIVPPRNIFDQKYSRIITTTSLCNPRKRFRKIVFSCAKISPKAIVHGLITI